MIFKKFLFERKHVKPAGEQENFFIKYGSRTRELGYEEFEKWITDGVAIGKITQAEAVNLHRANVNSCMGTHEK